jgi:hypothetical protein
MQLLIDVDALCKLAHWRLLAELPGLSGFPLKECASLSSARHRANRALTKPDGKTFRDVAAAQEAVNAIDQMRGVIKIDPTAMSVFEDVAGIDAGEAVLLTALDTNPGARLLTGDKRALRALAELPLEVRQRYAGKIILVECVLLAALNAFGLEWLRERVCPWKEIDKSTIVIMGSRCDLADARVREGIASYIREMVELCDPSLVSEHLQSTPGAASSAAGLPSGPVF